jgi:hypothetical protein
LITPGPDVGKEAATPVNAEPSPLNEPLNEPVKLLAFDVEDIAPVAAIVPPDVIEVLADNVVKVPAAGVLPPITALLIVPPEIVAVLIVGLVKVLFVNV